MKISRFVFLINTITILVLSFYLHLSHADTVFTKLTPLNGEGGLGSSVNLTWSEPPADVGYYVCVDSKQNDSCDTYWEANYWQPTGALTSHVFDKLGPGKYYWQVITTSGVKADDGIWSTFTVGGPKTIPRSLPAPTPCPLVIIAGTAQHVCPTPTPVNLRPTGWVDGITSDGYIQGWALDPDHLDLPIDIHIYFDTGAKRGAVPLPAFTDVQRDDVNTALKATGKHGFKFQIPEKYRDGNSHFIYAYGIDRDDFTGVSNAELQGTADKKQFKIQPPCTDNNLQSLQLQTDNRSDGKLYSQCGKIYVIENSKKRWITSPDVFAKFGYRLENAKSANLTAIASGPNLDSAQQRHTRGTLVRFGTQPAVWFIGSTARYLFPNETIFYAWGNTFGEVVSGNSFDLALPIGTPVALPTVSSLPGKNVQSSASNFDSVINQILYSNDIRSAIEQKARPVGLTIKHSIPTNPSGPEAYIVSNPNTKQVLLTAIISKIIINTDGPGDRSDDDGTGIGTDPTRGGAGNPGTGGPGRGGGGRISIPDEFRNTFAICAGFLDTPIFMVNGKPYGITKSLNKISIEGNTVQGTLHQDLYTKTSSSLNNVIDYLNGLSRQFSSLPSFQMNNANNSGDVTIRFVEDNPEDRVIGLSSNTGAVAISSHANIGGINYEHSTILINSDAIIDAGFQGNNLFLYNLLLHEFGHLLDLSHNFVDLNSIMQEGVKNNELQSFKPIEVVTLVDVYDKSKNLELTECVDMLN